MSTPCPSGKMGFGRKEVGRALEAALGRRKPATPAPHLRTYHCPDCGLWHLTHNVVDDRPVRLPRTERRWTPGALAALLADAQDDQPASDDRSA